MNFQLRPANPDDQPFLARLYNEVHAPEFAPLGLPATALEQMLALQYRVYVTGCAAQFPSAIDKIIEVDGTLAGHVLVDRSETEMRIIDIALLDPYRSQGIGTHILRSFIERAAEAALPLRLSVRYGSPAERLYARMGFVRTGGDGVMIFMECGATATALAAPESGAAATSSEPPPQGLTSAYFRSLIGQAVHIAASNGAELEVLVDSVVMMRSPSAGVAVHLCDSFITNFHGPLSPILPADISRLTPPGAEPMELCLVALGPRGDVMTYESVFNRMTPVDITRA